MDVTTICKSDSVGVVFVLISINIYENKKKKGSNRINVIYTCE